MRLNMSTRALIFLGLGVGSALGAAIGVLKNEGSLRGEISESRVVSKKQVQLVLDGIELIVRQTPNENARNSEILIWSCRPKTDNENSRIVDVKEETHLLTLQFKQSKVSKCSVLVPHAVFVQITGTAKEVSIEKIQNSTFISLKVGDVIFLPKDETSYSYSVQLKNGTSDVPATEPGVGIQIKAVIDKGDFTVL